MSGSYSVEDTNGSPAALASLPTHQHPGQDLLNRLSHSVPTQALFERAPQNRCNAPQACALVPEASQ
eukprot:1460096-Pleurochrysis_carterae.AAC.1